MLIDWLLLENIALLIHFWRFNLLINLRDELKLLSVAAIPILLILLGIVLQKQLLLL